MSRGRTDLAPPPHRPHPRRRSNGSARVAAPARITGGRRSKVIGYSAGHRAITAYELGNPRAPYRAAVIGSMHGYYERVGETVTRTRSLPVPTGTDLWVIDTVNPDGDGLGTRARAHGVDLNRNWGYAWVPIARHGLWAICYGSLTWIGVAVVTTDGQGGWSARVALPAVRTAFQARYVNTRRTVVSPVLWFTPTA